MTTSPRLYVVASERSKSLTLASCYLERDKGIRACSPPRSNFVTYPFRLRFLLYPSRISSLRVLMLLAIAPYGFVLTPVKNKRIHKASVIFERDKGIEPSSPFSTLGRWHTTGVLIPHRGVPSHGESSLYSYIKFVNLR